MPTAQSRIAAGADRTQNARIVREMTDALVETLAKRPEHVRVTIAEIAEQNRGHAGMPTDDHRALGAKGMG